MQEAYVPLNVLVDFMKNRNNELAEKRANAMNRQQQSEARFRQMEVADLMTMMPEAFQDKLVFAETEE